MVHMFKFSSNGLPSFQLPSQTMVRVWQFHQSSSNPDGKDPFQKGFGPSSAVSFVNQSISHLWREQLQAFLSKCPERKWHGEATSQVSSWRPYWLGPNEKEKKKKHDWAPKRSTIFMPCHAPKKKRETSQTLCGLWIPGSPFQ